MQQEILATDTASQASISAEQTANTPPVCPELMGRQVNRTVGGGAVLSPTARGFNDSSTTDPSHEGSMKQLFFM